MRLDRLTVSGRRLVAAGGGAAGVVLLLALGNAARPEVPVVVEAPAAAPAQPPASPTPSETATDATPDHEGEAAPADDAGETPADMVDESEESDAVVVQEAAAYQVAADFAGGYAQYHFNDLPSATVDRVRPFVTEDLALELSGNSGALAARQEQAARRERAVALVQAVQHQQGSVSEGRLHLLVVVRQDVSGDGGSEVRWPTYVVEVVRTDDGWRVARLMP